MTVTLYGTGPAFLDNSGNLGIGTIAPGVKLDVTGLSNIRHTYTGAPAGILFGQYNSTGDAQIQNQSTSGIIAFATNNSERMRIDSSGKVGIGTPSINSNYLQLGGSGQYSASLAVRQSRNSIEWGHPNQAGYGSVFGAEEPSGHSFIALNASNGTNNNTYKTWGLNGYVIKNDLSGPALTFNYLSNSNADNQTLTERMRIDSTGNIRFRNVGDVAPWDQNTAGQGAYAWLGNSTYTLGACNQNNIVGIFNRYQGSGVVIEIKNGTTVTGSISHNGSTTAFNTSSDYRLKHNVKQLSGGISTISKLNPVSYKWKYDDSYGEGFIAHELQSAIPEAVTGEKDAVDEQGRIIPQGVDYSKIVVHLVAALQELKAEFDSYKATHP